jgi:hypothetical protein
MKLSSPIPNLLESIESHFSNQYKKIRENIALVAYSMIRCQRMNTGEIARQMGEVNGLGFKANDMKIYRLLQSKNFQVDDRLWRGYVRLFFKLIKEHDVEQTGHFFINVDYTTDTDDFLILCASLQFQGQLIPLYFSMRKSPKREGMHDQKKLETAFFKALRHVLPKGYQYTIVADRDFGDERIIELLETLGFKYVLRLNEALTKMTLKQWTHQNQRRTGKTVRKWKDDIFLIKRGKSHQGWILATNWLPQTLSNIGIPDEGAFSIDKMFKNKKSGGFDLEKLKIEKYDRFKKILFIACIAYAIMMVEN